MNWDYVLLGLLLFVNAVFTAMLSFKFAKSKTDYQAMVIILSFVLSLCFPPAGWIHCWHWSRRLPDKDFIKFD
jgi:hypothetical protein